MDVLGEGERGNGVPGCDGNGKNYLPSRAPRNTFFLFCSHAGIARLWLNREFAH